MVIKHEYFTIMHAFMSFKKRDFWRIVPSHPSAFCRGIAQQKGLAFGLKLPSFHRSVKK
jgi:hypothetical protein